MPTQTLPMTAEQLLGIQDENRHELIHGDLRTMPPAGHDHGHNASNAHLPLALHVKQQRLGRVYAAETGYVLDRNPDHVRAPDVSFVRAQRVEQVERVRGYFPGPPDLAVEVVSPDDTEAYVLDKVDDWLSHGTRLVWVVWPTTRSITVHRAERDSQVLHDNDMLDGEDVVPGFQCQVRQMLT